MIFEKILNDYFLIKLNFFFFFPKKYIKNILLSYIMTLYYLSYHLCYY